MIQRVQSLFLLTAVVFQIIFISTPLARFISTDSNEIIFYSFGFISNPETISTTVFPTTMLCILSWIIAALSFTTIFLYKKRIIQMRFCKYNLVLNIGTIALMAFYFLKFKSGNIVNNFSLTPSLAIPVANTILMLLSIRGIRKDELLVKGYERLR
jgi:hypothetical protein